MYGKITDTQRARFPLTGSAWSQSGEQLLPLFSLETHKYRQGMKFVHQVLLLEKIFPAEEYGEDYLVIRGVTEHEGALWAVYVWEAGDFNWVCRAARPVTPEEKIKLENTVLRLRSPAYAYTEWQKEILKLEAARSRLDRQWYDHCSYVLSLLPQNLACVFASEREGFQGLMNAVVTESIREHGAVKRSYYPENLPTLETASLEELEEKFKQVAETWSGLMKLVIHLDERQSVLHVSFSTVTVPP